MKPARPKRTRQRARVKALSPALREEQLKEAQAAIGHTFRDPQLLVRALTHPSAVSAAESVRHTNQRLEFLGDRVLNLVIAERLFDRRRSESEGDLAPRLNRLVRKSACADAFRHLSLQDHVVLSASEEASGGRNRESILGDACEAVIAAVYLDAGLSTARKFIEKAWAPQFSHSGDDVRDPKTKLQEWAQGLGLPLPGYEVLSRSGPDHEPTYEVQVTVEGRGSAVATGHAKREAERAAAKLLLQTVGGETE